MKENKELNKEIIMPLINNKYYIIQRFSSFEYGRGFNICELMDNLDDIIEAHFFDETGYLHIFTFMDRKKAIYVTEDEGRETLRETQLIKDKGTKRLEILKALDYDDFGQMYVEYTRPYKLS